MRFATFVLLAGCTSGAARDALQPRALAAVWIGLSADGSAWYRLDLDDEGTGMAATSQGGATAVYRVRRWSDGEEMTVHLEVVDGPPDAAPRLDLRGRSGASRLELAVEGRHSVTFWRESDLIAARNRLRERMAPRQGSGGWPG